MGEWKYNSFIDPSLSAEEARALFGLMLANKIINDVQNICTRAISTFRKETCVDSPKLVDHITGNDTAI